MTLFTDTYATLSDIDALMVYNIAWSIIPTVEKENRIKAASLMIDNMMFHGLAKVVGQDMKFPRFFNGFDFSLYDTGDDIFNEDNQKRMLREAVRGQVEYDLNRTGIGVSNYSCGSKSGTPRQDMLCRESKGLLAPYVKW